MRHAKNPLTFDTWDISYSHTDCKSTQIKEAITALTCSCAGSSSPPAFVVYDMQLLLRGAVLLLWLMPSCVLALLYRRVRRVEAGSLKASSYTTSELLLLNNCEIKSMEPSGSLSWPLTPFASECTALKPANLGREWSGETFPGTKGNGNLDQECL